MDEYGILLCGCIISAFLVCVIFSILIACGFKYKSYY